MSDESHEGSSPLSYGEGPGVRSEKRCSKCGETKPLDAFSKRKNVKDGHQDQCKKCKAEYSRAWEAANADKRRAGKRARRATHPEVIRQIRRAYYAANADRNREYARKYKRDYYAANADRIREYQREYNTAYNIAYRAAHPEYSAAYNIAYRAAHPGYRAAYRAAHPDQSRAADHRRRALKKGNGGDGFTVQELLHMQLVQGDYCAYCLNQHPKLTIDHIIPLKQRGRHEAANICLACPKCNFSKGNRTPDQWINRWYYQKSE